MLDLAHYYPRSCPKLSQLFISRAIQKLRDHEAARKVLHQSRIGLWPFVILIELTGQNIWYYNLTKACNEAVLYFEPPR